MSSRSGLFGQIVLASVLLTAASVCTADDNSGAALVDAAVRQLAEKALFYAGVLASASTVAMAFLELFKAVTGLRRRIQQWRLRKWLGKQRQAAEPELLYLAIGDQTHIDALCGQPIEKMMGQLQAAAHIALDYPDRFPELYRFLTTSDWESKVGDPANVHPARVDRELWQTRAARVHDVAPRLVNAKPDPIAEDPATAKDLSDAAQAKVRLASLVGRKLDGFQLETDFIWSRLNQGLSILFSIVIMEFSVFAFGGIGAVSGNATPSTIALGALLGLVGGLIAPFAKDFSQSLASFASK